MSAEGPDRWRDEDGPSDREVEEFVDRLDALRLNHPDRVWTSVTVAHLEHLTAASSERVELRKRLAACEAECRRLRDDLRSSLRRG